MVIVLGGAKTGLFQNLQSVSTAVVAGRNRVSLSRRCADIQTRNNDDAYRGGREYEVCRKLLQTPSWLMTQLRARRLLCLQLVA